MGRVGGGLDRTFRPNKTCYNYDDGCYIYRQDIVHSMLNLPGSSSLLGKCPYSVAHPKPVVNVIHYKLSRLHHHTLSQSLQGQPVLSCPVTSMSLKLWFTLKMAVTFFQQPDRVIGRHYCICIMGNPTVRYGSQRNIPGVCIG